MTNVSEQTNKRLQGKVAQLLNERELVINIGETDGVRIGMKFKVLSDVPVEISDPETGEVLGTLDREKVRVLTTDVQEKYSICRTYRVRLIGGGPLYGASHLLAGASMDSLTAPPRKVPETLKAEDSEYLPPLRGEDSYVKRGDRVIELKEGEDS